jgi:hypothetical protein
MKNLFCSPKIVIALLAIFGGSAHAEITSNIDMLLNTFVSGSQDQQIETCRDLEIAGISDKRLFDQVEKNLLASYKRTTRDDAEYAAWLTKCLAFSGDESYRKTIEEVALNGGHRGTKRHGLASQQMLSDYRRWNPELAAQPDDTAHDLATNRIVKAFRVNDLDLQMAASKWAFERTIDDEAALDVIGSTAQPLTKKILSKERVQAVAYMLKALARTGNPRYRSLIEETASTGSEQKLRKYAASYLKSYY